MKCGNLTFNAQGSKVIIVVVHVGLIKIYVVEVEVPKQKKIHDETHFTTKFDGFMNFTLG
jgi:hypothetical protein